MGVATIVQGTFVQGDFCPRSMFDVLKAAHIIFCSLYKTLVWYVSIEKMKNQFEQAFYW